jgi:membrane-bound lytic murein transglycosylase D
MMRKILTLGLILFLSSACLPQISLHPKKTPSNFPSPNAEEFSLFTPSELEELFSQEGNSRRAERRTLLAALVTDGQPAWKLEPPISDESNNDFIPLVSPEEPPKKGVEFDIPIVINARVEAFLQFFQTTLKNRFSSWLGRSAKYIPSMKTLLKENGLPEDLVYLALIESGFNPYAYSRSKAMGPWQFIYLTGKRYGLKVNWWVDERRDPEKSTIAAAKYLRDLYDMFECWYLAAAGYNAGEGKIARAMKRYRTEDFWELAKYPYLKKETRDYVPQMIAAAVIAKDPEQYGFTSIEYQEPLRYEKVRVPEVTDLGVIAKACETPLEELKDLNPELLRNCTPPEDPEYEIKIPYGKKELFLQNFETLQPVRKVQFKTHIVKQGDTFSRIAKLYGVDLDPILQINQLKKTSRLSKGMDLLIPIPLSQESKPVTVVAKKTGDGKSQTSRPKEMTYVIKKGDSLWSIANERGVNIGALSRWNNLDPEKKLVPGTKLKIMLNSDGPSSKGAEKENEGRREVLYRVREGDTLWSIAKKYNLTIADIKTWNRLDIDRICPEDQLALRVDRIRSSTLD